MDGVPVVLRPLVWLTAVLWLPVRGAARVGDQGLALYVRAADAAGRGIARAARAVGRALVRVLGPLGRALRTALTPVWRAVRRAWDRLGLWVLVWLLRPVGRLARWVATRCKPAVSAAKRMARAVVTAVAPVDRFLTACATAVGRAATRLGAVVKRVLAPVGRAVAALTRGRAAPG